MDAVNRVVVAADDQAFRLAADQSRIGGSLIFHTCPEPYSLRKKTEEILMPAYWVARAKINDPVDYKKYTDLVPGIIAKYGGKVLARGGRCRIMEGPGKFHRFVVIEFPTFEQGVACFTSEDYDRAAAFRRSGAGEVETIMVEGGDAT